MKNKIFYDRNFYCSRCHVYFEAKVAVRYANKTSCLNCSLERMKVRRQSLVLWLKTLDDLFTELNQNSHKVLAEVL